MKKNIISAFISVAMFSSVAYADDMADQFFSGTNPTLTVQEKAAIDIAKKWNASTATGLRPVAGQNGAINFLFGAQQPSIVCAVLQVCDVSLQAGEQVNGIHLGDTARWTVEPAITGSGPGETLHLIIKPLDVGLETSLVVTTNRRTYHMRLRSHRTEYMPQVAFSYPEDSMAKWDACSFTVDLDMLSGRVCYGGLDLSSTTDVTAFVLVFPPEDTDGKYEVLPFFWIPEENIDLRVRRDHVQYDLWEKQGFLLTTEGNVVHYGFIEKFIEELGTRFNIREIAFDRWGAVQMVQNLEGLGFTVVPFGQGFKDMSPPTKELMKLTLEQKLAHGGHPVLRWMMDNIYVRTDPAGNIKPDKEKSTEKIDGAVATIMALDRAIRCGGGNIESVYSERGLLIL